MMSLKHGWVEYFLVPHGSLCLMATSLFSLPNTHTHLCADLNLPKGESKNWLGGATVC